jgi:hypothetical protein
VLHAPLVSEGDRRRLLLVIEDGIELIQPPANSTSTLDSHAIRRFIFVLKYDLLLGDREDPHRI